MPIEISQRKLESYKRAEIVARELRHQFSANHMDYNKLCDLVVYWMSKTGRIKYDRPVVFTGTLSKTKINGD